MVGVMAELYSKTNPYMATLALRRRVNSPENKTKETVHIEIDLGNSGLVYKSGDSLGVFPRNTDKLVDAVLVAYKLDGNAMVTLPKATAAITLRQALTTELNLGKITKKFALFALENLSCDKQRAALNEILSNADPLAVTAWVDARHVLDIAEEFDSIQVTPQVFVEQLRKQAPRLYSISSSPKYVGANKVHLTVAVVRYETNGRSRDGVCSTFLGEYAPVGEACLPVFVANSHFGPPADTTVPMIMVGPGTGVAPFRSFVQDRKAEKASGKNWLFFGDQHEKTDFLYEDEWKAALADGSLTKLSCAWSRDQEFKIYVQDKIREAGAEIWQWLDKENGAFFICGDAKRMAKDVEAALLEIFKTQGGLDDAGAADYLKALKTAGRYQKDVY